MAKANPLPRHSGRRRNAEMGGLTADWIGVDWGTTALRAWALDEGDKVLAATRVEIGMGALEPAAFEPALVSVIGDWLRADRPTPVLCAGMVGARQGWLEAPYLTAPTSPHVAGFTVSPRVADTRMTVAILPGVQQLLPPDVMRGEETQIAGLLSDNPTFDGTVCLPGTHAKWVEIRDGEIKSFRTFMTGEVFALLSAHSVLRHSMSASPPSQTADDEQTFLAAVADAQRPGHSLTASLFAIRAAGLVSDAPQLSPSARLSGLLIGDELRAVASLWRNTRVHILGTAELAHRYELALRHLDADALAVDGESLTLRGLTLAYRKRLG